jgi:hypothetical protein
MSILSKPEAKADILPDALVHQALAIAQKVSSMLLNKKHKRLVEKKKLEKVSHQTCMFSVPTFQRSN